MLLTRPITSLFLALLLTLFATTSHALVQPKTLPLKTPVTAYQVSPDAGLHADRILTISLNMEPDWYAYGHIPGPMGRPTNLSATTQDGSPLRTIYPAGVEKPDAFDPSKIVTTYASGSLLFVFLPADAQLPITLHLDLLLCHPTKCVPAKLDLTYSGTDKPLPVAQLQPWWQELAFQAVEQSATSNEGQPGTQEATFTWEFTPTYLQPGLEVGSLLSAVLMGLLAGLILNIMPCVLPVVSLKLSALLHSGTSDDPAARTRAFRQHNLFFSLGIIIFFIALALILGLTGQAWGALFQSRWIVFGLAAVIGGLSLSLFGLFHLPVIDLKFGSGHDTPRAQAFFTGMLTTLLATPCSGPFLGGVLGWALIQGPLIITSVFVAIGVGMALPYLLMVARPGLARFLPRSGPWIEYVEKLVAFFLVGTTFYLISIALGSESLRILAPLWVILFGVWFWLRTRTVNPRSRWTLRVATIILLAMSIAWTTPGPQMNNPWEPFDPAIFNQQLGNTPMFVDFTADWCPTCKVLEATVLTDENIARWKLETGIMFIKVDMTRPDPDAEALLRSLGSQSIPTAALFHSGDKSTSPLVLRDLFTESQLENTLESWNK